MICITNASMSLHTGMKNCRAPPNASRTLVVALSATRSSFMSLSLILLVVSLICFIVAAAGLTTGRINALASGLAFWVLSILIGGGHVFFH
jgi:methyl coenzyme M reductase beta subunit